MARRASSRRPRMVVVDLSRGSIKLALAESAGEAVRFHQITAISPPHDGESAYGADDSTVALLLRQEVERNGWRGLKAACLLSRAATSTQSFHFPDMPEAELRQAIELKLAETLHFGLDEATYGYRALRQVEQDGNPQTLTLVAAAQRATVLRALRLLTEAGLRPVAVSAAAESLANLAYHARLCSDGEATIHVDIGDDSTILNLFEDRLLRFSREIDASSHTFTQALMRPILTADGPVQLSRSQAEEVRAAAGCPREDEDLVWPHGVRSQEILPLIEPVILRLANEIERSVGYMRTLISGSRIDRIVLSGPSSRMRNLGATLSEHLGLPVTLIDPVERACAHWRLSIREAGDADTSAFSAILGYATGARQPINLMPRDEQLKLVIGNVARTRRVVAPFAVAGAAAVALAAVPILEHYDQASASMRWALEELATRRTTTEDYARRSADAEALNDWLTRAQGPTVPWTGLLQELSLLLPEAVQLTGLSAEQDDEGLAVSLLADVHSGAVPFEVTVTELTVALGESPLFVSTSIVNAVAQSDGNRGHLEARIVVRDARLLEEGGPS